MPELDFKLLSAEAVRHAAAPLLAFKLEIACGDESTEIQNVLLRCQIQIEVVRRRYSEEEQAKLYELFGRPEQWGTTLKTMLWTNTNTIVRPFSGSTVADVEVPCTFDFNVAATKYFDGLADGEIPLCFLFSGSVFYKNADGRLQVSQISWEKEADYRLSVSVWRELMEHYYPNTAWLNIRKDVFDELRMYRMHNAIPSWEQTFEKLLKNADASSDVIREHQSGAAAA